MRGDCSPVAFSRKDRESFVQAEFLFRSKNPVKVVLRDLSLSDKNKSEKVEAAEKQSGFRKVCKVTRGFTIKKRLLKNSEICKAGGQGKFLARLLWL